MPYKRVSRGGIASAMPVSILAVLYHITSFMLHNNVCENLAGNYEMSVDEACKVMLSSTLRLFCGIRASVFVTGSNFGSPPRGNRVIDVPKFELACSEFE